MYQRGKALLPHPFPRFIWAFIPGLLLALITWIAPKGRPGDDGRLCVDPSTILDNEGDAAGTPDDGADYVVFGFPSENRRAPCLNPFKWTPQVGFTLGFLGYLLDTQTMTVQWQKTSAQLAAMLDDKWLAPSLRKKTSLTPRNVARLLGLIRQGALVSVIGSYLLIQL